jgi:glycosyltransferase involved in cell wall biosynthesis
MKKNILILCSRYLDSTSANGVCAKNLAEAFHQKGFKVWVIAVSDNFFMKPINLNGVLVYGIPHDTKIQKLQKFQKTHSPINNLRFKLYRLWHGIQSLLSYPIDFSSKRVNLVFKLSQNIIDENGVTIVLGTSFPYHSVEVAIKLKKLYKEKLHIVTYHFDLMFYPNNLNPLVYKYKRWKFMQAFKNEVNVVDKILLPESYKGTQFASNVSLVGLPVYIIDPNFDQSDYNYPNNTLNITYIGSLDSVNRNPRNILTFFREICKKTGLEVRIHIWGKLVDGAIFQLIKEDPIVEYHGTVENRYVMDLLKKTDFILNLSNKVTYNLIPSKIFQFFASNKPIINFVQNKNDMSLKYFTEYANSINIETNSLHLYHDELITFILNKLKDSGVSSGNFERFSPSYICEKIITEYTPKTLSIENVQL